MIALIFLLLHMYKIRPFKNDLYIVLLLKHFVVYEMSTH